MWLFFPTKLLVYQGGAYTHTHTYIYMYIYPIFRAISMMNVSDCWSISADRTWPRIFERHSLKPSPLYLFYGVSKDKNKATASVATPPWENATFFARLWRRHFPVFAVVWKHVGQNATWKWVTLAWRGTYVCVSHCFLQYILTMFKRISRGCFI